MRAAAEEFARDHTGLFCEGRFGLFGLIIQVQSDAGKDFPQK